MNRHLWFALFAVAALAGCQTAPPQPVDEQLVASQAVVDYFDDPEVEQVIAGQGNDVKCVRHRRVGTHLIVRVCRTKAEWAKVKEQERENAQKIRDRCLVAPDDLCGGLGRF